MEKMKGMNGPRVKATVPGTLGEEDLAQGHEQPQGRGDILNTLVSSLEKYPSRLSRLLPSHGSLLS